MIRLALSTVRSRKGGFVGAFIALLFATVLVAACGILMETGIRAGIPPERYAGAPVVVAGDQQVRASGTEPADLEAAHLPERVHVDAALVDRIREVDGVRDAIGEVTFPARVVVAGSGEVLGGPEGQDSADNSWGHAWASAELTPFALVDGDEPRNADDVVLDAELARRAGLGVGDDVTIQSTAAARPYRVSGIVAPSGGDGLSRQSALFFADEEAGRLAAGTGEFAAIGVLADPGADLGELRDRIIDALAGQVARSEGGPGLDVVTGTDRGTVEFLDAADAREMLIAISGSFGGVALMVALFVVASTFALLVQQRSKEIALLRAVAATPRQVRRMICREAQLVAVVAGIVGIGPAVGLAEWIRGQFVDRGILPESFGLRVGPVPFVVAIAAVVGTGWLAAWTAARRASRIVPTQALGESAVEPKTIGRRRVVAGVIVLVGGVSMLIVSTQLRGEAAAALGVSVVIPLVTAAALLSPLIARMATAALGVPLRRVSQRTGYLAVANARANARRMGAVITPLVLAMGVAGVVLFQQATLDRAAERQAGDGMSADRVVVGDAGVPGDVADTIGEIPGVATAASVVQTGVVVEYSELGEPTIQTFTAQGVDPSAFGTGGDGGPAAVMDLDVREGSLGDLGDGTVAVGRLAADTVGAEVGERLPLRLGDGTLVEPVVVAIYERGLGFGDFTFTRSALDGHLTDPLDDMVLMRFDVDAGAEAGAEDAGAEDAGTGEVDAALADLPYAGLQVLDQEGFDAARSATASLDAWVNLLIGGVLLGYIAISVANSLVVGTSARARELALLRLVGTTQRQVLRMMRWEGLLTVVTAVVVGGVIAGITLVMMSIGLTGRPVPYVPPLGGIALVAAVITLGLAAILLPTRYVLRANPTDTINMRE
ncbi:ABC transporter permease [Phytoactinopolyspora halotolerans]|uniref:FtsX-like permease family protein n=1 Tax=Phytoactinopolyspora halotolerans TaxID=1981512 RepID=A0A6L9S4S8_9ACTN|nr:ABC transporter permease [Phytoactinopolyspora halotolerans]NEE00119.1 FtsX-like permease family protein [Phytoactinopolyspora halotolerans]